MRLLIAFLLVASVGALGQTVTGAIDWGRQIKNKPFVDVREYGAKGDGSTDDTAAFAAAVATGKPVFVPGLTFRVSSLDLASDSTLIGEGASSVLTPVAAGDPVIHITGTNSARRQRITIRNLHFKVASPDETYAIRAEYTDGLNVSDNVATNVNLFRSQFPAYGDVTSNYISLGTRIVGNTVRFDSAPTGGHCIWLPYTADSTVANNVCQSPYHGITFWGGDSNPAVDGAIANTRWAKNLTFTGNIVRNSVSGIWGSMGENVVMVGNVVKDISDVGLDMEGVTGGVISGNTAENCVYGCISTFFLCRGINVTGNVVSQTTTTYPMLRLFNSGLTTDNRDITIASNTFNCKAASGSCVIDNANGPYKTVSFVGNTLFNTRVDFSLATSQGTTRVSKNVFSFTQDAGAPAIKLSVYGSESGVIAENEIRSSTSQTGEAILAYDDDYNSSKTYYIRHNVINGFANPIHTQTAGTNDGITATFMVQWNTSPTGSIAKTAGGTQQHVQYVSENQIGTFVSIRDSRPDAVMTDDATFVSGINFMSGFRSWNVWRNGTNSWETRGDGVNNGGSLLYGRKGGQLYMATVPSTGTSNQTLTDTDIASFTRATVETDGIRLSGGGHAESHLMFGNAHLWWDSTNHVLRWKESAPVSEANGVGLSPVGVPASATTTCTAGDSAYNTSYMYYCVATDTWKKVALIAFDGTWGATTYKLGSTEKVEVLNSSDANLFYVKGDGTVVIEGRTYIRVPTGKTLTVNANDWTERISIDDAGDVTLNSSTLAASRPLKLDANRRVSSNQINLSASADVTATGLSTGQVAYWESSSGLNGITGTDITGQAVVTDVTSGASSAIPAAIDTTGMTGDTLTVAQKVNAIISALGAGDTVVKSVTKTTKSLSASKGVVTSLN